MLRHQRASSNPHGEGEESIPDAKDDGSSSINSINVAETHNQLISAQNEIEINDNKNPVPVRKLIHIDSNINVNSDNIGESSSSISSSKFDEPFTISSIKIFDKKKTIFERVQYINGVSIAMITGKWYCLSVAKNLQKDPSEVYDRLLNEWATMSVISALMMSFAYTAFVGSYPATDITYSDMNISPLVGILCFISISLFLVSICSSVLLSMGLMTLPKEASISFVEEFHLFLTFPELFMVTGLYLFSITTLFAGEILFGPSFKQYGIGILALGVATVLTVWLSIVLVLDRNGGLWEKARNRVENIIDVKEKEREIKERNSLISAK